MTASRIKTEVFAALPPEWMTDPLSIIRQMVKASGKKIVVLDDDPTGTQTVYGIPVLTEWSVAALSAELSSDLAAFYLLTNTRSMSLPKAQMLNREIGAHLVEASRKTGHSFVVASRSDSTLRGHFPSETDALSEALGGFDADLLVPAFMDGGRYTLDDVHYVAEGENLYPAGETEFARDAVFGYKASNLREWVQEKTQGRIQADSIASISLMDIRQGGPKRVTQCLLMLQERAICVVNAVSERDLAVAALGVIEAEAQGKRFLYRTAASFVAARAGLAPRPLLTPFDLELPVSGGGLIVVGSYVPKTSGQLQSLLETSLVTPVEIQVENLLSETTRESEIQRATVSANQALGDHRDVVIFTSRKLITSDDPEQSLSIGQQVSESLVAITQRIAVRPRYVLVKGGITSSDIATHGLNVKRAMVLGQILRAVPVWQLGNESRYPGLAYIVFPGNVGDKHTLLEVVQRLKQGG